MSFGCQTICTYCCKESDFGCYSHIIKQLDDMKIVGGCRMEGKMDRKSVATFSFQSDKDKLHYLELEEMSRDFSSKMPMEKFL